MVQSDVFLHQALRSLIKIQIFPQFFLRRNIFEATAGLNLFMKFPMVDAEEVGALVLGALSPQGAGAFRLDPHIKPTNRRAGP